MKTPEQNPRPAYRFSDDYLGISDEGVHVLRNKFELKIIPYTRVTHFKITQGKSIKNWILLLAVGILLLGLGVFLGRKVFAFLFNESAMGTMYLEQAIFPLFIILIGLYSIYRSIKKKLVLVITENQKSHKFSLNNLIQDNTVEEIEMYLKSTNSA